MSLLTQEELESLVDYVSNGGGFNSPGYTCDQVKASHAAALARIEELEDLVEHCWVHSGYQDCGRVQMTTELKELYDETVRKERNE